ncbi:hypothetical protein [Marinobacter aromaticivorans]|uniref:Polysaccharide lyase n=1 Tax=Marinobacter aromaticivorans TaxID=1494078 RepID=A0ABW2IU95_9GAMM|nr:hypothetical protein [Marinobacter aromaticivorans]
MNKFALTFTAAWLFAFATFTSGESIVYDSFESGDFSAPSAHGFRWSTNSAMTSIVTSTTELFRTSVINAPAPEGSQWEAKSGEHALRLFYPAGQHWTEQKFYLDKPQPEIWMSFWLRVPTNFTHPKRGKAGDNQKLFRLWMDKYSQQGDGSTVGMSFRGDGHGGSYFFAKINGSHDIGKVPFIAIPGDRGRWMHLVVHLDSESVPGASDGLMEVWRKWEGDTDYTKTHDIRNQPINLSSTKKGFAAGYLMGYANAVYPVDTEFMIDDFELSTSPLFLSSNVPNPPLGLYVR